jgi:hypothetical protein
MDFYDTPLAVAAAAHGDIIIFDLVSGDSLRQYKLGPKYVYNSSIIGKLISNPAAIALGNQIHVVGTDKAGKMLHYDNGNWGEIPGGKFHRAPTICSWGGERLDVFALGDNWQLWHSYRNTHAGAWTPWIDDAPTFPGGLASSPASVSWGSGRIDIVALDDEKGIWHVCYDEASGGWMGWHPIEGIGTSAPTICSMRPDRLDIFVRGQDGTVYHRAWDNGWSLGWANELKSPDYGTISGPVAVAIPPNQIYLVVRVSGYNLTTAVWHKRWNGSSWDADWLPTYVK